MKPTMQWADTTTPMMFIYFIFFFFHCSLQFSCFIQFPWSLCIVRRFSGYYFHHVVALLRGELPFNCRDKKSMRFLSVFAHFVLFKSIWIKYSERMINADWKHAEMFIRQNKNNPPTNRSEHLRSQLFDSFAKFS